MGETVCNQCGDKTADGASLPHGPWVCRGCQAYAVESVRPPAICESCVDARPRVCLSCEATSERIAADKERAAIVAWLRGPGGVAWAQSQFSERTDHKTRGDFHLAVSLVAGALERKVDRP